MSFLIFYFGVIFFANVAPDLPGLFQIKPERRRSSDLNNLHDIGIALHYYHDEYGSLPPAYIENIKGEKIHSWRALILPYMGEDKIFHSYKLSEPWYSTHNRKVARDLANKFQGKDRFWSSVDVESKSTETDYVVVIGPQTAFPGKHTVKFESIKDCLSNTIFVVQKKHSGIDWFEPRDIYFEQVEKMESCLVILNTSSPPNGITVLLGDGSSRNLGDTTDAEQWRNLLFINGDKKTHRPDSSSPMK